MADTGCRRGRRPVAALDAGRSSRGGGRPVVQAFVNGDGLAGPRSPGPGIRVKGQRGSVIRPGHADPYQGSAHYGVQFPSVEPHGVRMGMPS